MEIKQVEISKIKEYKNNIKKHPEEQIKAIANSIREFGFRQPLVLDKGMEIIVGHGRFEAAKSLGMDKVPCVMADDLTDEQVKAFRIADNKTNESDWDFDLLSSEIEGLDGFDLTDFGFNEAELLELTIDDSPEAFEEPKPQSKAQFVGVFSEGESAYAPESPQEGAGGDYAYQAERVAPEAFSGAHGALEAYAEHAAAMVTKRVIIVYKNDEEEAYVRSLLGVSDDEKLGVIYLAENLIGREHEEN